MVEKKKAWVVAVNMGYGHQRTAYPLKDLAPDQKVVNANSYEGIPDKDKKIWESSRIFYEFISRFRRFPLMGEMAFSLFNKFQEILNFYPRRDLSKPNFGLKKIFSLIKKGWGRNLVLRLRKDRLPLITTFFTPAFMAEVFNFPSQIYCVVCDADIARSWAPLNPSKSKIKYFAPCNWVVERLKLYGVKEKNIFLTGYPLPKENIGGRGLKVLKHDLSHRILNLDPKGKYRSRYQPLIDKYIGVLPKKSNHPLTVMFAVGGAGAQKRIGIKIMESLKKKIEADDINIILVAGIRKDVEEYFLENIERLGLEDKLNKDIRIIFAEDMQDYFKEFNQALRTTDILWTKPSELSFYSGLGLPIIIAPSIGSQEDFNKKWLLRLRTGFLQENPRYTDQWLFDLLNGGRLAEAAVKGLIEVENSGTYKIEKICFG